MRWPGIEPGSTAWKAAMLTIIPPTLLEQLSFHLQFSSAYIYDWNGNVYKGHICNVFVL